MDGRQIFARFTRGLPSQSERISMSFAMASLLIRSALVCAFALATAAGQDLPKRSSPTDLDLAEPKLMLNDVPKAPLPGEVPSSDQIPADVAKLEAAVERAKKNAAFRERLFKQGVLCKLEAEQGEMKVVQLTKDLANARVEADKRAVEELQKQPALDESAKKTLAQVEERLTAETAAAQEAVTKFQEAQRAAAEIRVWREKKLLALGAGSRSAVKRAEAALQTVAATPAP